MKVIREYNLGKMKVTEYEINTKATCDAGIHVTGHDGTHCKHCGIDILDNKEKGEGIHFVNTVSTKRKGTLDDFIDG